MHLDGSRNRADAARTKTEHPRNKIFL